MLADGMTEFVECGLETVLKGLIRRVQMTLYYLDIQSNR